jgi:hypothetical protein
MRPHPEAIHVGSRVGVVLRDREGNAERLTVIIVPADAADFSQGYLGENTPLAQALIGETAGSVIPYLKDDIDSVEVVEVSTPDVQLPEDTAKKRQAALKKAMREVQDTSAMLFASSFSGKWGDYDPDSLPKDDKPPDDE